VPTPTKYFSAATISRARGSSSKILATQEAIAIMMDILKVLQANTKKRMEGWSQIIWGLHR
jgi:hypothetical protein